MLAERGIDCGVANARFAKPLDLELLAARARIGAADPDARGAPRARRLRQRGARSVPPRRLERRRRCACTPFPISSSSTAPRRCSARTSSSIPRASSRRLLALYPGPRRRRSGSRPARAGEARAIAGGDGDVVNRFDSLAGTARHREAPRRGTARFLRGRRARDRRRRDALSRSATGPCTSARRSFTTATSSTSSASKGALFVEEVDDVPDGAWLIYSAHGIAPAVRESARAQAAADDRRDVPARHEGSSRGDPLRPAGLHDHPHRPRGPRRDDRHARRGARRRSGSSARPRKRRRSQVPDPDRVAYLTQTTLSLDDTREIVAMLQAAVPEARPPRQGRHLLRDAEPAGRGQGDGAARRPAARPRRAEQLELAAALRGRARRRASRRI